jgi:LysR family transcriptional regulator, chromosome initiation inhibitor
VADVIDRRGLETLVAAVDAGTFDLAAQVLRVTPSAVSQRVKALENELGRVLLERTKPVRATSDGEALVRLGRQVALLEHDALGELGAAATVTSVPIAVNADSLATWLLPALVHAAAEQPVAFEVLREDQTRTPELLLGGRVMAAITSRAEPVPGCSVTALGAMRYRPVATPAYMARHLPDGATPAALAEAPLVDFDRDDDLQSRWLRSVTRRALTPPRHRIAASAEFARAVELGLGWGMLPDAQADDAVAAGRLLRISESVVDVPLYWQQWNLRSPLLDAVAACVVDAARAALEPPRRARAGARRASVVG